MQENDKVQKKVLNYEIREPLYYEVKNKLSKFKQAELYPLIQKYIPDYANEKIQNAEKILVDFFVANKRSDLIPEKNTEIYYRPRKQDFHDNLFENEKHKKVVKQLSLSLIDIAKENPIVGEKIKKDAIKYGNWMEKNSYLSMMYQFKTEEPEIENEIKPDWWFRQVQYVNISGKNFLNPAKIAKSQEGLMYHFLTEQMNSIEYLYTNYANANKFYDFSAKFNMAVKSYDKKQTLARAVAEPAKIDQSQTFKQEPETKTKSVKIKMKI